MKTKLAKIVRVLPLPLTVAALHATWSTSNYDLSDIGSLVTWSASGVTGGINHATGDAAINAACGWLEGTGISYGTRRSPVQNDSFASWEVYLGITAYIDMPFEVSEEDYSFARANVTAKAYYDDQITPQTNNEQDAFAWAEASSSI